MKSNPEERHQEEANNLFVEKIHQLKDTKIKFGSLECTLRELENKFVNHKIESSVPKPVEKNTLSDWVSDLSTKSPPTILNTDIDIISKLEEARKSGVILSRKEIEDMIK